MIEKIYNEKLKLNINKLKISNIDFSILDDRSILFKNYNNDIYSILKDLLNDSSLDPNLIFNKLPLSNNDFIISF